MRTARTLGLLGLMLGGGLWICGCSDGARDPAVAPGPEGIFIQPDTTYQTLRGFGASLAWYQGSLVWHPLKEDLYEVLFADLGLDILRFRNRFERTDPDDANLEEEAEIIQAAAQSLGHPPTTLLTSWSPPAPVKANAEESCTDNADCTLRKDGGEFVYDEFAAYWHDSLEHYASLGIVPDYISIQNEPDFIPGSWAGCHFTPTETDTYPGYDRALQAVHERLNELDFPPGLLGPETLGIHYNRVAEYLGPLDLTLLDGIAHHLYESGGDGVPDWKQPGPDGYLDEMRATGNLASDRPLFQTEFGTDQDDYVEGGFELAWLIHSSLVEEGTSAFLYWDLVWPDSGLVALPGWGDNPRCPSDYCIRDQYYSLRHFSRYTDPGWVRVGASSSDRSLKVSAFTSPERDQLTVVLLNTGSGEVSLPLDLGPFDLASFDLYRTIYDPGASRTWEQLDGLGDDRVISVPSRSVITLVARL